MNILTWLGLGIAGGFGLRKIFSSPPMRSVTAVSTPIDKTVMILGRQTYLYAPAGASRILFYFHGFTDGVSRGPKLAKALGSASTALVVPQLGPKSEIGDLDSRMAEYLAAVRLALGTSGGAVDGVSHSGGYRGLAAAIRQVNLSGVGLLDSLYGEYPAFASGRFSCLIDLYGTETAALSEQLKKAFSGNQKYQILPTKVAHVALPEIFLGDMARAFPTCAKMGPEMV